MRKIGIFGGSFNPVHEGHLALARAALSELNLDGVIFVPSYQTPLKPQKALWPIRRRCELLRRAIRHHPFFSISLCEVQRKTESFTVDTLRFFKAKFGRGSVLYFLTGADNLKTLSRWKSVDQIFKLCRFVVMTRPGYSLNKKTRWPVLTVPFEALTISSSRIRKSPGRFSSNLA